MPPRLRPWAKGRLAARMTRSVSPVGSTKVSHEAGRRKRVAGRKKDMSLSTRLAKIRFHSHCNGILNHIMRGRGEYSRASFSNVLSDQFQLPNCVIG